MSKMAELQLSEISQSFQSEDKKKRLEALQTLRGVVQDEQWSKQDLVTVWSILSKHMAKLMTDPGEACRMEATDVTKTFLQLMPVVEKNILYVMTVLVRRLSSQELLEPSEEVRLSSVALLRLIIHIYKEYMPVYVEDIVAILAKTVTDNYPKVKRESCEAIAELAEGVPAQFYSKSEAVVKPILTNFTHQHYRVRVASVKTIGAVLQHGHSKSMEVVATPMAERLFDQSGAVRAAVVHVAGNWLLNLRDRYSWWHKLIPLLLTGLHDEIQDIREQAGELWEAAGRLYLQENDSDEKIKDKMDFLIQDPQHYPPKIQRPNLGCRIIAQQNIGKLVGGISRELGDWMADIRVRSAQLLAVLVLNVEQDIIQHIEKLLPAMYRACGDQDSRVVENVELSAEYMGYFVPPEIFCPLVLPTLEDGDITAGHLAVFAAILRGSEQNSLRERLHDIGHFLQASHICRSKKSNYQQQILRCCEALLRVSKEDCEIISYDLFVIILTTWSMTQERNLQELAKRLMDNLALIKKENLESLYALYLPQVLCLIADTSGSWTIYSPELYILKFCLTEARSAATKNLDLLLPMLENAMSKDSEVELRLKLLILLSDFFQQSNKTLNNLKGVSGVIEEFVTGILVPALIWSAGKASETLRTAAIGCLCALFDTTDADKGKRFDMPIKKCSLAFFVDEKRFSRLFDDLRPILMSLIDDNARKTRLYALRAVYLVLSVATDMSCVTDEDVVEIYPVVIKRLDDGCNDVRCAAVEALVFIWRALPSDYDVVIGKSHLDYLYTTTIVHLDDPEAEFQALMLDAMMQLALIYPEMLVVKIEKCKTNFRNQAGLKKLLEHCHELLKQNKV